MRDANRGDAAGWKALVAALRRQDTISSTETTVLVKQLTAVSPDCALRDLRKPIGVAEWRTRLVESLPKRLQGSLPSIEQLEAELGK
jgi:hypothetical protein